jgi:GrpB-like predicted nucleotidyltransferase (UPF0157 family)/polyisoprenoid-binding protein YceI
MTTTTGPSDVGTTAASQPPIGNYQRVPVQVHQADPDAPEVSRRLIALIATRWPVTPAEQVGSTAVPGLAGKGIIDLLLAAEPAHLPAITQALFELGFQPQSPAAFPPTRPMLWGAFRYGGTDYPVHVHVVPASSPEIAAMRGFRDALRADPRLRRRYVALKRAIVAGGPADPVAFTKAKHEWIAATLTHLGLADEQPRRLYIDDLDPDNPDRLASRPLHPSLVSGSGTWTIDPADSSVTLAWRKLRFWTITGQLHCLGVIHLDDLPPVGVIRFQQPSGLPVLTMALDPASLETQHARLDALLRGPDAVDVLRPRWWTLRSESLEVLPGGTWRVMATLTANGTHALIELRFETDPEASGHDWLVLRGRGVLDRRAFGMGKRASFLGPTTQLDLTVRARQVETSTTERQDQEKGTCTTSMPG